MAAWIGAGLVVQNVISSVFNSQLFYFTPGWLYVIGVGVLGGVALRDRCVPDGAVARTPLMNDRKPEGSAGAT